MNIIFMGTPDFALESLKKIYEAGHNILAVVSQPDKKSGRGMKLVATPVKEFAIEKNIEVYQPEKIRKDIELIEKIREMQPDVIVVVAFGQIIPQSILDIPKYGAINVHGSLLPKYRGAAPIQWSIINGDGVTGITTMCMDAGVDTGDIIEKFELAIDYNDTYGSLYDKMKVLGGEAIVHTLAEIEKNNFNRQKQPENFSIAPMIEKEMGEIDWNKSSMEIRNLIRGFNPFPGAYFDINGERMKVWQAEIVEVESNKKPGEIIKAGPKEGLMIKTGDGAIELVEIQMPNLKKMTPREYLRGHKFNF